MEKEANKVWKISNRSNGKSKVAIALPNKSSVGIILEKDAFVLASPQMTRSIDMQEKRGFISIDKDYINENGLGLGTCYTNEDMSEFEKNTQKIKDYKLSSDFVVSNQFGNINVIKL